MLMFFFCQPSSRETIIIRKTSMFGAGSTAAQGESWLAEAFAVSAHSFAMGAILAKRSLAAALVASLALELVTTLTGGAVAPGWTLFVATVATAAGAAARGARPRFAGRAELGLALLVHGAAYMLCRRVATETAISGFPSGAVLAMAALAAFYVCDAAIVSASPGDSAAVAAMAAAVAAAHVALVVVAVVASWLAAGFARPEGAALLFWGAAATAVACGVLLCVAVCVARIMK